MIPYIAIAAGVTIGASILRCIFDELSSEEIERQEEIQKSGQKLMLPTKNINLAWRRLSGAI